MHPQDYPGVDQIPEIDIEKKGQLQDTVNNTSSLSNDFRQEPDISSTPVFSHGRLARWNAKVESLAGLEARGITRVQPEERHDLTRLAYIQMFSLWFGMNLVVENVVVAFLGPLVFGLGWIDCVCILIFAMALASAPVAYMGTFGPQSGNRTMVCAVTNGQNTDPAPTLVLIDADDSLA